MGAKSGFLMTGGLMQGVLITLGVLALAAAGSLAFAEGAVKAVLTY